MLLVGLFLVDDNLRTHKVQEALGVLWRRNSRDSISFHQDVILQQVLYLLVKVVILQVVNDANMVDESATSAEELVPVALEATADLHHLGRVGDDRELASVRGVEGSVAASRSVHSELSHDVNVVWVLLDACQK